MICRFCGNVIDDNTSVCPYCGSAAQSYAGEESYDSAPSYDGSAYDGTGAAYDDGSYEDDGQDFSAPAPKKKLGGGFKLLRHRCGCICRIIRVYMVIYHNDSPPCRFIALFGMTIISRSCNIFNMFFP